MMDSLLLLFAARISKRQVKRKRIFLGAAAGSLLTCLVIALPIPSAALKMITDMERIGDQAEDIAEITQMNDISTWAKNVPVAQMASVVMKMVTESIDAYVDKDLVLAKKVIDDDDTADSYFNEIKNELIGLITKDSNCGVYAIDLLMISKYLERIGDHATNIAEWVEYSVTGIHKGQHDQLGLV